MNYGTTDFKIPVIILFDSSLPQHLISYYQAHPSCLQAEVAQMIRGDQALIPFLNSEPISAPLWASLPFLYIP